MPRVKRGTTSLKRRRNILGQVKGYRFGRSTKERQAREAIAHAGSYAFNHRRDKKSDFRRLWQTQINAAVRRAHQNGESDNEINNANEATAPSYSRFIHSLKKSGMGLNRKVLAQLAETKPEVFNRVVAEVNIN